MFNNLNLNRYKALTDDRMASHMLGNIGAVASHEARHQQRAVTSMNLASS